MSESNVFFKRLVVEKGVTAKVGEDYVKATYLLEVDLSILEQNDKVVEDAKKRVENMVDKWIDEEKGVASIHKEVAEMPDLDLAELEKLGWKNFQKEPCKPLEVGWIMRNTQGAEKLSEAIAKANGELEIGNLIYCFSGDKQQFINRKTPKKESAKK
jgi:TATA-binding protein-associated factor Taf7